MLSDKAMARLSRGMRHAAHDDAASDLDPPTEVGVSLDLEILGGRFRLLGRIAAGGMGVVHRALDVETGIEVAVKIPNLASPLLDRRFQLECDALTAVVAPAVVRVLATGTAETPFLAMELVRGETLGRLIRERGSIGRAESLGIATRVAAALAMVHAAGWIHRDVKPANVTVTEDGDVRLVDFGLARSLAGPGCGTATGHLVGTLSYMAPEQLTGAKVVDTRIDIFALGCVLFECLVGRNAFRRLTSEVAEGIWDPGKHPELACAEDGVDADVAELVRRFAAPEPERRPIDGLAALAELCALDESKASPIARAGGATSVVRAAVLGAVRGPVMLLGHPGAGRARSAIAAATLLTEMLAPCRALMLRGNPRSGRIPGAHAVVLAHTLREAGFRNAARALTGTSTLVDGGAIEPSVVLVVLDANFCDKQTLDRVATAAASGLVRVIATARSTRDVPVGFMPIDLGGPVEPAMTSMSAFERWTLRAGAMFGTVFEAEGAAHLVGGPEAERVAGALAHLVERGTLRQTDDGRFAFTRSADWYAALGSLSPRDVRLGVSLVDAFEAKGAAPPPEVAWLYAAVRPPVERRLEGEVP